MAGRIIFIGTSHIDPDGYSRLIKELNSMRPEIILLEVSHLSVILRRTYGYILGLILRHNLKVLELEINPEIRDVACYLDLPYEYRAVRDYCRSSGSEYILVDVSFYSFMRFMHAHKLVTKTNLLTLSGITGNRFIQEKAATTGIFYKKDKIMLSMKLQQFRKDHLSVRREKILLKRLEKYTGKYSNRKIFYVGGWEHLIYDQSHMLLYTACRSDKIRLILV